MDPLRSGKRTFPSEEFNLKEFLLYGSLIFCYDARVQREWKERVLYALELALMVAEREGRSPRKIVRCNGSENEGQLLGEGEREALGTLILSRLVLQMESSLRGHPNYRKACRVLEELPLWSLDKETALQVIDRLSSIIGLPFCYAPKPFRSNPKEEDSVVMDVGLVVKQKIEMAKQILGEYPSFK